ncbi:hypothetical protein HanXRQr2_Chr10g0454651 [Helianthus annuus]|uniref:Uncharacterized protein n=1 Tax=Helianthus annuus TaxID=4232 RepID=A0A251TNL6_HELAN|nr:hypothetical protein HanXRQr2_Chr10g0454651 [Helianthus annuus]KAJ0514815.1 hypothetical protein HanHA300_Chr10g0373811 [Helianthus annuus]KAJ0523121.1 hypothetical protein HanIR_Chr10g0490271 [Helianthus annuus]KAJ0530980.1 hypothetical protein HanHA89_Chr10g0396041 [Helianthus annuus]KAJ0697835.1 hypothetical protein HanLR1_Chr10g0373461 [Helianthus annuus]
MFSIDLQSSIQVIDLGCGFGTLVTLQLPDTQSFFFLLEPVTVIVLNPNTQQFPLIYTTPSISKHHLHFAGHPPSSSTSRRHHSHDPSPSPVTHHRTQSSSDTSSAAHSHHHRQVAGLNHHPSSSQSSVRLTWLYRN